jgi:hypothetical protein
MGDAYRILLGNQNRKRPLADVGIDPRIILK